MKNWWVPQNCKVTAGNILLVFLDLPYVPTDQACACAGCKVRPHKDESPGTVLPVNFLRDRGLVFLLLALLSCCSSGQDDWCGRHVPLSTLRNSLTSSPWAQMSPLIFLMPVTLPLLLLVFPAMLQMQECFMKFVGGCADRASHKLAFSTALCRLSTRRRGWRAEARPAVALPWLPSSVQGWLLIHHPNAPKYMTASILSPCHSSPSHWCERVLYLPRRVMKIAMTMIVVAWECKELILPE